MAAGGLLAAVAVYSSACAIIDMQVSPADEAVMLDDGRTVGYLQYLVIAAVLVVGGAWIWFRMIKPRLDGAERSDTRA